MQKQNSKHIFTISNLLYSNIPVQVSRHLPGERKERCDEEIGTEISAINVECNSMIMQTSNKLQHIQ